MNPLTDKKIIAVDFLEDGSLDKVLSPPKQLISSRERAWKNIHFEYHVQASHETPEHYPTQHVVVIQTEGNVTAERRLDGSLKQEKIKPGHVCLVPAGTPHWIHCDGEQGMIFLSIDTAFLKSMARSAGYSTTAKLIPQFAKPDPFIYQIGLSLKSALQNSSVEDSSVENSSVDNSGTDNSRVRSRFYVESLTTALAAHLLYAYSTQEIPPTDYGKSLPHAKVQLAVEYINDQLSSPLSLEAIADAAGLSQYHLCRAFKPVMGMSPWQYVIQQRTELAKRLLKNPRMSVAQISSLVGFSSQGQFSNFFRRRVGMSPTQYRKLF